MIDYTLHQQRDEEAGFTLVELAVVMIIIGLLIGGVLKGQELITNAEVSNTVQTVQTTDSAVLGFRDAYAALPGDAPNAGVRIPNCGAAPCDPASGNQGNRHVENDNGTTLGLAITGDSEAHAFFIQLTEADFISGIEPDAVNSETTYPSIPIGQNGVIQLNYSSGIASATDAVAGAPTPRRGHWFVMHGDPGNGIDARFVEQAIAGRIDRKLDNGTANTGDVLAAESAAGLCSNAAGVYLEADRTPDCALYISTSF